MNGKHRFFGRIAQGAAVALAFAVLSAPLARADLVTDPDFATVGASGSPWVESDPSTYPTSFVGEGAPMGPTSCASGPGYGPAPSPAGCDYYFFGPNAVSSTLTETLSDTLGQKINVSAYLDVNGAGAGNMGEWEMCFDTTCIYDGNSGELNETTTGTETSDDSFWQQFTLPTVIGTGTDTLSFTFVDNNGWYGAMADASADPVPTPEPASLALLGSGLLGFSLVRRRKRRS